MILLQCRPHHSSPRSMLSPLVRPPHPASANRLLPMLHTVPATSDFYSRQLHHVHHNHSRCGRYVITRAHGNPPPLSRAHHLSYPPNAISKGKSERGRTNDHVRVRKNHNILLRSPLSPSLHALDASCATICELISSFTKTPNPPRLVSATRVVTDRHHIVDSPVAPCSSSSK